MLVATRKFKYYGQVISPGQVLEPQPLQGTRLHTQLLSGRYIAEDGAFDNDRRGPSDPAPERFPCRKAGCDRVMTTKSARTAHERSCK
jgi:hypothetical protein